MEQNEIFDGLTERPVQQESSDKNSEGLCFKINEDIENFADEILTIKKRSYIFNDKGFLNTDFVDESRGRDEQKKEIRRHFADIKSEVKTEVALFGPPGTGKSLFARNLTFSAPFEVAWISCSEISPVTKFQAAAEIARELDGKFGKGNSAGECLEYIRHYAEKDPLLIVIDEVDKLARKGGIEVQALYHSGSGYPLKAMLVDSMSFLQMALKAKQAKNGRNFL